MAGNRLFRPDEGLDVRPPTSNTKEFGRIVNTPRYMEFGGLESGGARGISRNNKSIAMPGATQVRVPQKNRGAMD